MEIILKQDVENLGFANEIVNVKPGYARNYLIPKGMAVAATPSAKKMFEETMRQRAQKEAKLKEWVVDDDVKKALKEYARLET